MRTTSDGDQLARAKAALRRSVRARRAARSPGERADLALDLERVARQAPALVAVRAATAYVALPDEPDVSGVRRLLTGRGARVWLPVVTTAADGSPALEWADDGEGLRLGARTPAGRRLLEPRGASVPDPGPLDVVLVPALAVDHTGVRLGQGAGYYDRTVQRLGWRNENRSPTTLLVAVVHDDEVLDEVPGAEFDIRVDAVLTPSRWISCSPAPA